MASGMVIRWNGDATNLWNKPPKKGRFFGEFIVYISWAASQLAHPQEIYFRKSYSNLQHRLERANLQSKIK